MSFEPLVEQVERYYSSRFADHGPTARGVDWKDEQSQELRFRQLLRVLGDDRGASVLDFGCGYGALAAYLRETGHTGDYLGYDVSRSMIEHARGALGDGDRVRFTADEHELVPSDFGVASGVFNVKLDEDAARWRDYVVATIERLAALGRRGFAFNMLTSYADSERMRDDLYYGDPGFFFDLCKRRHAQHVSLLHDYGLWEFTILARSEPAP